MIEIFSFLFFLNLIIFVHEFGHFLLAKKFNLPVLEFSLGFPPKIFSKKIKETVYSFGIILLGGYVKLQGEDNPEEGGFYNLPVGKRILITLGGIIMNLLFAYLLFSLSFLISFPRPSEMIVITDFLKDSPFKDVFQRGDIVKSLKIKDQEFYFKNPQELSSFLKTKLGEEVIFKIERNKEIKEIPVRLPSQPLASGGVLGVYLSNLTFETKPFPFNFLFAAKEIINHLFNIFKNFFYLIGEFLRGEKPSAEIVGPIGIFFHYRNIISWGLGYIFYFLALLSLYLVFFNILPFPALDGGRILFFLYEALTKKRFNPKFEMLIHQVGFFFLFALLILITFKDILKLNQR